MGQQYSSQTDGLSAAATSPHSTTSLSPPSTRADIAVDMRPTSAWTSNTTAVMPSLPNRSEAELGEHLNFRPRTENEVTRMSIRAVIDTFIENCLSANNDNSPLADDKHQHHGGSISQGEDVSGDESKESLQPRSLASSKDGSDCLAKAADCLDVECSQKNYVSAENLEVNELASDNCLLDKDINNQEEQFGPTNRDVSQTEQAGSISGDNSQADQPGFVSRNNSPAKQPPSISRNNSPAKQQSSATKDDGQENVSINGSQSVPEKELTESGQKIKTSEHSQGSSYSTSGSQTKTERQTFSAYLQERLKTIDIDKREELTQLALSKNIQCQGQMFMWEMMKKPMDDFDSTAGQSTTMFPSGPVRLQTVIDRVLDKSLLNQDLSSGRGRDNIIGEEHLSPSVASLSAANTRERVSQDVLGQTPASKTRMCFKDHIEKVLLESFLSFEEDEKAEALRAEAQSKLLSVEGASGSKVNKAGNNKSSTETENISSAKGGTNRTSLEAGRLNSSKSGTNKTSLEAGRLNSSKSGTNRTLLDNDKQFGVENVNSREMDMLNSGSGANRPSVEKLKSNKSIPSIETDSEKFSNNNPLPSVERDRVSDGTISVQDIVDQVINQTEMISRLLTPSTRDSIKLTSSAVSSDCSSQSQGISTQANPSLRYQDSSHNRALSEAQRHAVHKEHQSSTTLGRKRGRPRLGSPVNTSVKCLTDTGKPNYQDQRCGPVTSYPSKDYLLTKHFSSGPPGGFSSLGVPQIMRPSASAVFQQGHDKMPSAMYQQSHDKIPSTMYQGHDKMPSTMYQQSHDRMPSTMYQQSHDKMPSTMYQQGHDKMPSTMYQQSHDKMASTMYQQGHDKMPSTMYQQCHDKMPSTMYQQGHDKMPSTMYQQDHDKMPSTMYQQSHDKIQKTASKSPAGPASIGHHPHDNYQQHHGGHNHFPNHPHQPQSHDGSHMSSSNVQLQQIKDNISNNNRLIPVSHIPIKSCSCHVCLAHFAQRKSPSQIVHVQQHLHTQTFSKADSLVDQAHLANQSTLPHMVTSDFYSQTISPSKEVPVITFPGQSLSVSTYKKDISSASSEAAARESVCYSSGHYQAGQGHTSQSTGKPQLFDPRLAGSQVKHYIFQEGCFQRVGNDNDPHLLVIDGPKLETNQRDDSMVQECDQPLDLSLKPCPPMRSYVNNSSECPRQDTEIVVKEQPFLHSSSILPARSEVSLTELGQRTSGSHHLQKLESSVDRFLHHRHSQPQLHVSLYSPAPLYPQSPHFFQHRPKMSPSDTGHTLPHQLQEHHVSESLSQGLASPIHAGAHPPSPATQLPHQSSVTFTHPPSPAMQLPHQSSITFTHPPSPAVHQLPPPQHRQDIAEALTADQYQARVVLVENLPRSKDVNQLYAARADYQRPPSHNHESRPQGTPSLDVAITSSPSHSHSSPSPEDSQKLNLCKHEPIQNIIGNHSPSDILYLICRICKQTYGSPYGFRKHFRNQHGFEPKADHTVIQTISATKTAMAHSEPLETTKKSHITKDDLDLYDQFMKSSPGDGPAASRQTSHDPVSSDDCKSDLLKELPAATKCLECPECGQTFQLNDFGSYKRHCRQHSLHRSSGPFACHDCERSFSEPAHLQDHLTTHSSFTPSVCGICRTFFSSPNYLAGHLQAAHGVGSDTVPRHVDTIDSTRKCVSEPVTLADKSTSFSDVPDITSPSLFRYSATTSGQNAAPSNFSYAPSLSGHCVTPSTIATTSSVLTSSTLNLNTATSSTLTPSIVHKQVVVKSATSSSLPPSKHHRFSLPPEGSQIFTVHTPKGLEIQKLPADAVVTSASPDSSYDEAKGLSGSRIYSTENVSNKEVSKDNNCVGENSSLSSDKIKAENVPIKVDNTNDNIKCDNKDEAASCSMIISASISEGSLFLPSPDMCDVDKSYQHKKYNRSRKRVTTSDDGCDGESKRKYQKVADRSDQQLPYIVSSTLNSKVTIQDCESSCSYSDDSVLGWARPGELNDKASHH